MSSVGTLVNCLAFVDRYLWAEEHVGKWHALILEPTDMQHATQLLSQVPWDRVLFAPTAGHSELTIHGSMNEDEVRWGGFYSDREYSESERRLCPLKYAADAIRVIKGMPKALVEAVGPALRLPWPQQLHLHHSKLNDQPTPYLVQSEILSYLHHCGAAACDSSEEYCQVVEIENTRISMMPVGAHNQTKHILHHLRQWAYEAITRVPTLDLILSEFSMFFAEQSFRWDTETMRFLKSEYWGSQIPNAILARFVTLITPIVGRDKAIELHESFANLLQRLQQSRNGKVAWEGYTLVGRYAALSGSGKTKGDHSSLDRVREAILKEGKDAKPDTIKRVARMNKKTCNDCLRTLESLGEYQGFSRLRPALYQ